MQRRHGIVAFLLTGFLGGQIPGPAGAVGLAPSAPGPSSTPAQSVPQSAPQWRLAQPTLANAENMVLGVPLGSEDVSRLPQTFANNLTGQLDRRSQRDPFTGGYLNIHQFEGVAGQTVNLAVTSDDFEELDISVFNTEEGTLAAARGSATQITLPLRYTGSYQVVVSSPTPERTGRYRLWWDTLSDSAFNYQGHSQIPAFGPENSLDGLFSLSLPFGEAEIAKMRTELGDSAPEVIEALLGLGAIYGMQERWTDAESVSAEVLDILRAMPNPNPRYLTQTIEIMGLMAEQRGDLAQAEDLYREALALQRTTLENLVPQSQDDGFVAQRSMTSALLQLARVYQRQQRYDEAEPLITEALELADGLTEPLDRMYFLELAAETYRAQGRGGDGVDPFARMTVTQGTTGDGGALEGQSPGHPMTLEQLARVAQRQGRDGEAEQLYRQAIAAAEEIYREDLQGYGVPIVYGLAGLYQAQGRIAEAIETLEAGIALEQRQFDRNLANLGEAGRLRYMTSVAHTLNHAISLHLRTAPDNQAAAQLAFTNVLRRKGRALEAGVTTLELLENNPHPEDQRLLAELDQLRQQLAAISFGESTASPQAQAQQRSLRSQMEAIDVTLARRSAALAAEAPPVELTDIQAHIPTDGVLVEYVRYRPFDPMHLRRSEIDHNPWDWGGRGFGAPRYAAYLLKPSGEVQWADLGDAATIDGQVQRFLEALRCGERLATPCYEPERLKPVAQAIYEVIFAPLQAYLGEATHLLLSLDGQLNLVPFAALVDEQNRYLVETYTLTHLTSGRDLLRMQSQAPSQQPPVVLADPNFDTADVTGVVQVASASRGGARSADMANLRFGRLEGSAQEVAAIRPLLGDDAVVLTEAKATENAVKQVQGPSILHLATHGFFLEDVPVPLPNFDADEGSQSSIRIENPLLRSGLALAGFNQRESDGEDGVLTALEVAGLNLRGTRLVVLSACETGLGDIADGEGVYGLRRAFVMAGAESQLMSLWQVSDRRTADLMQQYYERLSRGEGRSEALRQIQLAALDNPAYRHPYYWAAFFFSGRWTPMDHL